MVEDPLVEAEFLVPITRDSFLSDGGKHKTQTWDWLDDQLWKTFNGATRAPGLYAGFYRDPDTGSQIRDQSRKLIVALAKSRVNELRRLLAEVAIVFQQKCIYLSVAGQVEFIAPLLEESESDGTKPNDVS